MTWQEKFNKQFNNRFGVSFECVDAENFMEDLESFIQSLLQEVGEKCVGEIDLNENQFGRRIDCYFAQGKNKKRKEVIKTLQDYGVKIKYMKKINMLGMELDEWKYKSCVARIGTGEDWATVYSVNSEEEGKGHATTLLMEIKTYYEKKGLKFGGTVALNNSMSRIYKKLKIKEYK